MGTVHIDGDAIGAEQSLAESLNRIAQALDKIEESLTSIEAAVELWTKPTMTMNYTNIGLPGEKKGVTEDHG